MRVTFEGICSDPLGLRSVGLTYALSLWGLGQQTKSVIRSWGDQFRDIRIHPGAVAAHDQSLWRVAHVGGWGGGSVADLVV